MLTRLPVLSPQRNNTQKQTLQMHFNHSLGGAVSSLILAEAEQDGADGHLVHREKDLSDDEAGDDAHCHGQDGAACAEGKGCL